MDREAELTDKMLPQLVMQSHIWVGSHDVAKKRVVSIIKQYVCGQGGCSQCSTCSAIDQEQHHAVMWLYPQKRYTLDQFETVFSKLSFGLNENEQFFIVIQKADFLSQACANSLLKVLEEPSRGYYFFLLTERLNDILPTIRSRCMVHSLRDSVQTTTQQDLFDFLTATKGYNPSAFLQQLNQSNINERESVELLDSLFSFWIKQFKEVIIQNKKEEQKKARNVVAILKRASTILPMPGSSKLFWKDIYLQIKELS